MEQVIMAIAAPLARQYGINKAIEIAYEKLGLDIPTQTEVDVLTGGGINQAFSPANLATMAKRGLVNVGIRSLGKSLNPAVLGPLGLVAGLAFLGNKYRKQLTGFNTQAEYEAEQEARKADRRLNYITNRMLKGKDFANYRDALKESRAGAVEIDGTIYQGPEYGFETKSKSSKKTFSRPDMRDIAGDGGGHAGGAAAASQASDDAAAGAGGYRRGGIASL